MVLLVLKGTLVLQGHKEIQEILVQLVPQVPKVTLVLQVLKDQQELQVAQVLLEAQDHKDQQVPLD
jgi:hypothetical protein